MLQSMGWQRVRHDWATELNWTYDRSRRVLHVHLRKTCILLHLDGIWIWISESGSWSVMIDSLWPHRLYSPWNSPGHNTGVGSFSLLQGIFPIEGLNPSLMHCRQILSQLSHKGSPRILEWVAYSFSSRSSCPRNPTGVSCIAGGFFTNWAIREVFLNFGNESRQSHHLNYFLPICVLSFHFVYCFLC